MFQLTIYLQNKKNKPITAKILKGSLFECVDEKRQDLECLETIKFTVNPKEEKVIKIKVKCINPDLPPPSKRKYNLTLLIGGKKEVWKGIGVLTSVTPVQNSKTIPKTIKIPKLIPEQDTETDLKNLKTLYIAYSKKKKVLKEGLVGFTKGKEPPNFIKQLNEVEKKIGEIEGKVRELENRINEKAGKKPNTVKDAITALEQLTDDEMNRFCLINFPEVKRKFSSGMLRTAKINILIEYCQLKNKVDQLYTLLEKNESGIL